jgi:hypothetical protein
MDVLNRIKILVTATESDPITARTTSNIIRQEIEYYRNMKYSKRPL